MDTEDNRRGLLAVRVADLYLTGHSQVEIAEKLDISQSSVSLYLSEARTHWRQDLNKSYEEHLAEARETIRTIMKATQVGLEQGDPRSVEAATKLVERTAKLLGLDHADRISARMVAVEEAKTRVLVNATMALLDHLGLSGEARTEAVAVMRTAVSVEELV